MVGKGAYPFSEKSMQYQKMSSDSLWFARLDALATAEAMRGWNPEAEAWYMDDACTIRTVLRVKYGYRLV